MRRQNKVTPWYFLRLSPEEVRSWLRWASHKETDDKLLAKELRFMADELENKNP